MPYIYGQLIAAQLENKTSDYANTVTGAIWARTDTHKVKVVSESLVKDVLLNDNRIVIGTNGTAANNVRIHRSANSVLQFVLGNDTTAEGSASNSIAQTSIRPENYTTVGRPVAANAGRIIYDTNLGYHVYDNGSVWTAFGSGSSSAGAAGIEVLMQKAEVEKSGIFTNAFDNSAYISGKALFIDSVVGRLLKDTSSGVSELELVWNPVYLNPSDRDTDSTSNWSVVSAGASLTTSATKQIGTASLQFDKNNSDTEAGIRYDRGAQNFSLSGNTEAFFKINLPSITDLSDVYIKVYADSTSNYRKYLKTLDQKGNALATGWNLIKVDLENDSGTNTGTGWSTSQPARYVEFGVDTGNATQTYTTILVDSVSFSIREPKTLGLTGQELTIYDTSNKESFIIDSTNTRFSGYLTLAAATTNSFTGGIEQASAAGAERSTTTSGNFLTGFTPDLSSGDISLEQEVRFGRKIRASLAGDIVAMVDVTTPQFSPITAIGGATIDISDPSDLSANYASGDSVDVFRPKYIDGQTGYDYVSTKSLTASSTHSSGTTVLTLNVSGLSVDDIVVKRSLSFSVSAVGLNSNESFSAGSLVTSPDGIQILDDALQYPFRDYLVGHFLFGGALGGTNIAPNPIIQLTPSGTLNQNENFLYGRQATSGWDGSNYYVISSTYATYFHGTQRTVMSMWFYGTAFNGNTRNIFNFFNSPNTGIIIYMDQATNDIGMFNESQVVSAPYNVGEWNHLLVNILDGDTYLYVNGVKSGISTNPNSNASLNAVIGTNATGSGTSLNSSDLLADFLIFHNCPAFTEDQVQQIYNAGNYRPFNVGLLRYRYLNTGVTGQKISGKGILTRTTNAVSPGIVKAGLLLG